MKQQTEFINAAYVYKSITEQPWNYIRNEVPIQIAKKTLKWSNRFDMMEYKIVLYM